MKRKRAICVGNIFGRYFENDELDAFRILDVHNEDGVNHIITTKIDEDFHIINKDIIDDYTLEEFLNLVHSDTSTPYNLIIPEGTVGLVNVKTMVNENGIAINDVILTYYDYEDEIDSDGISVLVRQGLDDVYDTDCVGVSYLKQELKENTGIEISDLMYCDGAIGEPHIASVYKTDTPDELAILLDNEKTEEILTDLFEHSLDDLYDDSDEFVYHKGYCKNLRTLIDRSGFINDIYSMMGITEVDFEIKEGVNTIEGDDKILLSLLYGGIRINETYVSRWAYDIDLEEIKTKYAMIMDSTKKLYIVGYTESEEEWSTELKDQQLDRLHERLMRCAKVYTEED